MLDHFDKLILVDQVIPMLEKIKSREPAVLMAMLGGRGLVSGDPQCMQWFI